MENRPLKKYSSCYPPRKNHRTVPRPRRPDAIVPRFVDVDLALLGKRTPYLIIDVDNTLALSKSPTLSEGVAQHIDRARDRDTSAMCVFSATQFFPAARPSLACNALPQSCAPIM